MYRISVQRINIITYFYCSEIHKKNIIVIMIVKIHKNVQFTNLSINFNQLPTHL